MKALVTGGSGFVGQYLLEQLIAEGCETRSLNRHPSPLLKKLGVEERLGSLDDFEVVEAAVRGCDVVFHIAAYPSVVMDPAPYYRTNILGARNIVAACLRQRVRKLVYTSTQCVANTIESQEGIDESVPYAPQFLGWYQMTKAVAEQFVRAANYAPWTDDYDFLGLDFSEKNFRSLNPRLKTRPAEKRDPFREDALLTVALRPHLIWGPRDRHLVPRLLQRKRSGTLARVGDGQTASRRSTSKTAPKRTSRPATPSSQDPPFQARSTISRRKSPLTAGDGSTKFSPSPESPPLRKASPSKRPGASEPSWKKSIRSSTRKKNRS